MWDAILIHRTRARLASELSGRAVAGCISVRKKDGVVVSEYHYYDNRLSMSLLTRLDRLAEKEEPNDAHLRALSEDLDDYIDCVAAGGDSDAFVEERRPPEPEPPEPPAPPAAEPPADGDPGYGGEPAADTDLAAFAQAAGCPDYGSVDPSSIDIFDLDPLRQSEWVADQWVRAFRSGFMAWLAERRREPGWSDGPGAPHRFFAERDGAYGASLMADAGRGADPDISDLDPSEMIDWSYDQFGRAWTSGLLARLPARFWDDLATGNGAGEADE
jgi:hypothetical protein